MTFALTALWGLWGCAQHAQRPLVTPKPLKSFHTTIKKIDWAAEIHQTADGLAVEDIIVSGRGEGLNVASRVHRLLLLKGIQSEVRCLARIAHTEVTILFPGGLSPAQYREVQQALTSLIQPRLAQR